MFPNKMVVASDSHSNMYGGLGCLGTPVVRTDAACLYVPPRAHSFASFLSRRCLRFGASCCHLAHNQFSSFLAGLFLAGAILIRCIQRVVCASVDPGAQPPLAPGANKRLVSQLVSQWC